MVLFYSKESRRTRREETISRFRFGHTGLNSSLFIIGKNQMGKCSSFVPLSKLSGREKKTNSKPGRLFFDWRDHTGGASLSHAGLCQYK